jgi:hypothetical protein
MSQNNKKIEFKYEVKLFKVTNAAVPMSLLKIVSETKKPEDGKNPKLK